MKNNPQLLQSKNLSIGYDNIIHSKLNISLGQAELLVLIGENGTGKSTLLKTLAGNIPVKEGEILLKGKSLQSWSKQKLAEMLAVVWTESLNIGMLSVEEFVAYGRYPFINWLAQLKEKDKIEIKRAIELCGIEHLKNRDLQSLSDGEKQKVLIARAIAQNTDLIILDEPTTHLDLKSTADIFMLLKKISSEFKKSILISTHKIGMGLQIADKVCLLNSSGLIQDNPKNMIDKGIIQKEMLSENLICNFDGKSFSFQLSKI